jgi:hypothetical protein
MDGTNGLFYGLLLGVLDWIERRWSHICSAEVRVEKARRRAVAACSPPTRSLPTVNHFLSPLAPFIPPAASLLPTISDRPRTAWERRKQARARRSTMPCKLAHGRSYQCSADNSGCVQEKQRPAEAQVVLPGSPLLARLSPHKTDSASLRLSRSARNSAETVSYVWLSLFLDADFVPFAENGFKCHTMSENHLRQMLVVGESAGKHIANYTSQFQGEFVGLLSRRYSCSPLLSLAHTR